MSIGDRIKAKRSELGWSQATLAQRAGVSQQLIAKLELGDVLESRKIRRIARAIGVPHDELDPWETGELGRSVEHARLAPDDLPSKQFGAVLREKRRAQGMTQLELADRIGVTKGAVSHWELGRAEGISPVSLHWLTQVLKLSEEDLSLLPMRAALEFPQLPPLPQSEMAVVHMYAALPEGVRRHVRGIIEALSGSSREMAAMKAAYDATYRGAQDWMQKAIEGDRHETQAVRRPETSEDP